MIWLVYVLIFKEVVLEFQINVSLGLSLVEVVSWLVKYGFNDLGEEKCVSVLLIFVQQIFNFMILVCWNYYVYCLKYVKLLQVFVFVLVVSFVI